MSEHPVIACYRGLDSADAVQLGALLARTLGEPLVLASAYRYDPVGLSARAEPAADTIRRAEAAETMLRRARQFAGAATEVREQIIPALGITQALASLATDVDASMLVVGRDTSGRVARSLIARAPCVVAVAPLSVPLPMLEPLRRIAVAYDGSMAAQAALVAATTLARAADARLVLAGAGATPAHAAAWLHIASVSLGGVIEHESCQLVGDAATELARISGEVDLLICGSRGRGRALGAVLGSVSAHLVAHAQCPVLVVPPLVWRADRDPLRSSAAGAAA